MFLLIKADILTEPSIITSDTAAGHRSVPLARRIPVLGPAVIWEMHGPKRWGGRVDHMKKKKGKKIKWRVCLTDRVNKCKTSLAKRQEFKPYRYQMELENVGRWINNAILLPKRPPPTKNTRVIIL